MIYAVAYYRISAYENNKLQSLFEQYAEKNNLNLISIYADIENSESKIPSRIAFNQMIRDAQKNLFDVVLMWDGSVILHQAYDFFETT